MRCGAAGLVTLVPSSSTRVAGNSAATGVADAVGVGAAAAVQPARLMAPMATSAAKRRWIDDPLRGLKEGVGFGSRTVVPVLSREGSSTTEGPATGLPAPPTSRRGLVTVAGLCRILTGFADPAVLIFDCPASLADKPLVSGPRDTPRTALLPPPDTRRRGLTDHGRDTLVASTRTPAHRPRPCADRGSGPGPRRVPGQRLLQLHRLQRLRRHRGHDRHGIAPPRPQRLRLPRLCDHELRQGGLLEGDRPQAEPGRLRRLRAQPRRP